jgi:FkbH-like protein
VDPVDNLAAIRADVARFTFNDCLRHLKAVEEACQGGAPLRIAILRSYTVEPIEPILRLRLLLDGFSPAFWFGGYNQYVQEILTAGGPLYEFRPSVVLLLVRIDEIMPDFVDDLPSRSASEWERLVVEKARELVELAARLADATSAQIVIQNMTLSGAPYFGVHDAQRPDGQSRLVERFNAELATAAEDKPAVLVWDFDALVRATGYDTLFDPKMWYVSRNPFKQAAYPAIAGDLLRYLRSALGRTKKCIVLDLDNTLWGGVVGEDGVEGIQLGQTYPGNCYRDFQKELLKLSHRGLLLAIASKNNEADALKAIDEHPDMILRRRHFAAMRINWDDKAANLRAIVRELNIGMDAVIFIDDSAVECERIRQACPECDVVVLPDKPYLLPAVPRALIGVENIRLTGEDRVKTEMYRVEAARRQDAARYESVDEFIRSLEIEVAIEPATPFSVPRIAQLTQKTNQFNMTTRRYTDAQIQEAARDPGRAVFAVSSKDRFGDNGIIGVFILSFAGDECRIDAFLLSCRVIGRGIERAMMAYIADVARARRSRRIVAEFTATAKNQPAAGFYEGIGFVKDGDVLLHCEVGKDTLPYPMTVRVASERKAIERA